MNFVLPYYVFAPRSSRSAIFTISPESLSSMGQPRPAVAVNWLD